MKFIRNKLTGKIVYREKPHTDMTIKNASAGDTSIEDLEVVDEPDWSEQRWTDEIKLEKPSMKNEGEVTLQQAINLTLFITQEFSLKRWQIN